MKYIFILIFFLVGCGLERTYADRRIDWAKLDLERRALYLKCLHEYRLGTVVGEDLGTDTQGARKYAMYQCAYLAGLKPEDVVIE